MAHRCNIVAAVATLASAVRHSATTRNEFMRVGRSATEQAHSPSRLPVDVPSRDRGNSPTPHSPLLLKSDPSEATLFFPRYCTAFSPCRMDIFSCSASRSLLIFRLGDPPTAWAGVRSSGVLL